MPRFSYRALNPQGKTVTGTLEDSDAAAVSAQLRSGGLIPLHIGEKDAPRRLAALPFIGQPRVALGDVLEFTEQLGALLKAGLALDRALKILQGTLENLALQEVVRGIYLEVEKGQSLADAFSQYPRIFPRVYVNMIRAGEEGGILPLALERLIDFYERTLEFRNFLITSSIYPVLLFVFGIASLIVLTVVVIPKFGEIFNDMGQELPFAAAVLINTSNFLVAYGLPMLGGLALAVWAFLAYIRTAGGQVWWHGLVLRAPVAGKLILKIQLSRLCRTLGTLLGSGVPILTSIHIIQGLTDNIPLKRAVDRLQQSIKEGQGVARPLRADSFFPPLLGHLATVGEETGSLDKMLLKVADQYDTDIRKATKGFISIFEPAMIVAMGGLIGAIVVSMLTAIFSINDLPM
jgi:type II secretory pathway component PulF